MFKREADEYDSGLIKKYTDDTTTVLIFVSFSLPFVDSRARPNRGKTRLVSSLWSQLSLSSLSRDSYNQITRR